MAETRINVVDALRGQQDQLKRLIAQKSWLSEAPKATLSEIEAQVVELKRLLNHSISLRAIFKISSKESSKCTAEGSPLSSRCFIGF